MTLAPPRPQDVWQATPRDARALIEALLIQVEALRGEVAALQARLDANSSNSSKPPSTDPPHLQRRPPVPPSGKKRGGQLGHKRSSRPLVQPEQLAGSLDCKPHTCCGCGHPLAGDDPRPIRHQVAEIPEVRPTVREYRPHRLICTRCGVSTRGSRPAGVPRGAFGPRLQGIAARLGGMYRLSKRRTAALLSDLLGLSISTGMVCKAQRLATEALETSVAQIQAHVRSAPAAGVDETGWKHKAKRAWL